MSLAAGGLQRLECGSIPWHQHEAAYLALVLDGGYEESGDQGRFRVRAGDALVHLPFDRHANRIRPAGAKVVNIPLALEEALRIRSARLSDPWELVRRLADGAKLAAALEALRAGRLERLDDEVDRLADRLRDRPDHKLDDIARELGVAGRTLRRRFKAAYGLSACQYRGRIRSSRAWQGIVTGTAPLAAIALDHGFADQAHLSREIRGLTGAPPARWRRWLAK